VFHWLFSYIDTFKRLIRHKFNWWIEFISYDQQKSKYYLFYNILITLIALFSATFFYTRISLFLKKHFKHMNKPKITSVTKNSDSTKKIQIYDYEASTTQSPNELLNVSFQGLHLILFYSIHFFSEI